MAADANITALTGLVTDILTILAKSDRAEVNRILSRAVDDSISLSSNAMMGSNNTKVSAAKIKAGILELALSRVNPS
ncbi:MAG: hypothetical protein KGI68_02785 [Alphaproteobacteria bacterium]|nr:hypothetical protein [Alphaproteobacteria bacterium]MDE1987154.1 hypothetical protein [Alphaproteobacteria bacterium]MDE2499431.1 hypothetical protein [Alphaproteobacteria bacterium]